MPSLPITEYARDIDGISRTNPTEFTYRTPLEKLLSAIAKELEKAGREELEVVHEPQRESGVGAPDFLVRKKASGAVVGYVECKKFGKSLKSHLGKSQLEKYSNLSPNIILTNYQHFYLLRDNKIILQKELGDTAATRKEVAELIRQFLSMEADNISDVKKLVTALAAWCKLLREGLAKELPNDKNTLRDLFRSFKKAIYRDIEIADFADALAQTLVYGLLLAKLKAPNKKIDLWNVDRHIPQNFALVYEITGFLKKLDGKNYANIKHLVENILDVINEMNVEAVSESMSYRRKGVDEQDDPYLYFYETFLAAYDDQTRKARGVYYTPPPVVRFIVRATDDILRRDLKLSEGLADNTVTALDFATGTGTFFLEMIRSIFNGKDRAERDLIARKHLLKNFYGFEYLIAPYTIAHIKLSQFLANEDVELKDNERINVYLTNTLERTSEQIELPFMRILARETNAAEKIKEQHTLIVTGNPPYSGNAQTAGNETYRRPHKREENRTVQDTRDTWIGELLRDYYQVDDKPLGEKNPKWLQDDYVKFIRFAQWKMSKVEQGIVAIITNHAFMDNPTFRGMRQSLLNSFDRLYFLDLHGNSQKREKTPEGGKDENVFDIRQGVAVSLLVKKEGLSKGVFHADFWGTRENKYKLCAEQDISNINWKEIKPVSPSYLFIPRNEKTATKYEKFYPLADIFSTQGVGITTAHDDFVMDFEHNVLESRFEDFKRAVRSASELHRLFNVRFKKGWDILAGWDALQNETAVNRFIRPIAYRPFDNRHIFYEDHLVWRTVRHVMNEMLTGNNIALISVRQVAENVFNHVFITDKITNYRATLSNKGGAYIFPLYGYASEMGKTTRSENFNPKFRKWINDRYGKRHTPEDILGYIYAILHSPDYRRRYAEFLRLDFPRIPFPEDNTEFKRLAKIGSALIAAHLLRKDAAGGIRLRGDGATHRVNKIEYDEDDKRLYFNADEYLSPVSPEVFNFHIGGYRPLDRFLKSRKGRDISADIPTLISAANAIAFTLAQMKKIDK